MNFSFRKNITFRIVKTTEGNNEEKDTMIFILSSLLIIIVSIIIYKAAIKKCKNCNWKISENSLGLYQGHPYSRINKQNNIINR